MCGRVSAPAPSVGLGSRIPPLPSPRHIPRELNAPNLAFHINMALKLESVQKPGLDYPAPLVRRIADALKPSFDAHATLQTWLEVDGTTVQVTLGCLPSGKASRHNCPAKPHAATEIVKSVAVGTAPLRILVTLASVDHAVALGTAIARAFPLYSHKTSGGAGEKPPRKVKRSRESAIVGHDSLPPCLPPSLDGPSSLIRHLATHEPKKKTGGGGL